MKIRMFESRNFILSLVNSLLTDTSPGVGPCRFSLSHFTVTRRTTDTFETINGQFGGALCSEK